MTLKLYFHPFSSYSQKALIAFYELGVAFEPHVIADPAEEPSRTLGERWPMRRFPMLLDGERQVVEASCIVEYVDLLQGGGRLVPCDPQAALEVRMRDRFFDLHVMSAVQSVVYNALRPEADRDPFGVRQAHERLETAYRWLEGHIAERPWAAGETFSLADCAAAPALFYADWTRPIDPSLRAVRAYRERLLARPSVARAVEEARPFRPFFPLGAPDRD